MSHGGSSEIDLYNIALNFLGAENVMDPAQLTESALIMASLYPAVRDSVLRAHPWNCALERARLAANVEVPAWGFSVQYQLPSDPWCLRVFRLEDNTIPYKVEGRRLLCDEAGPLNILYIARLHDVGQFDALLLQAVAARLAFAAAYRITNNDDMTKRSWEWYEKLLSEARSIDGQEGTPEGYEADDFLNSRM